MVVVDKENGKDQTKKEKFKKADKHRTDRQPCLGVMTFEISTNKA